MRRSCRRLPCPQDLSPGMKLGFVGIGLLGILTFTTLASSRGDATQAGANPALPVTASVMPVGGVVPKPVLLPGPPELPPPTLIPPPLDVTAPVMGVVASQAPGANRLMSPGVVVDLTKGGAAALPPTPGLAGVKNDDLSADDKFADRVAAAENAPARAVRISNSSYTVPQGAIIAGVLETAINSDLPGYVRAVVSRDVMGFDGRRVLIPSGSRLIGQYRSGLAAGQSRAFIVWTRLTRPDGVTVSLGSPVTDPLGRAGSGRQGGQPFPQTLRFGHSALGRAIRPRPACSAAAMMSSCAPPTMRKASPVSHYSATSISRPPSKWPKAPRSAFSLPAISISPAPTAVRNEHDDPAFGEWRQCLPQQLPRAI